MTIKVPATYGDVPEYPTSQMMPREYWRKGTDGIPNNPQTITIETPNGPVKKVVERNWENPVYVGPSEDDPNQ